MMFTATDERFMARALELAAHGRYTTQPNPRVGCVIVRDGEIVGEGWHEKKGEPHAEPHALRAAGERARGATVYVTLEPHCFTGRTPPCTDALIAAGVSRVISAMQDPHPRVAGEGMRQLERAGVEVHCGLLQSEAEALNRGYAQRLKRGRPFVTLKVAASLDARTALANGESQWITCAASRADVQHLRANACAIVTGIGTVLKDDPRLTVRDAAIDTKGRQPLRVVLDRSARMSSKARMLSEPGHTLVVHGPEVTLSGLGAAEQVALSVTPDGLLDLTVVLEMLAGRECNEVLIEAGPTLSGQVLEQGLADEIVVYIAPSLLGHDALPFARLGPLTRLTEAVQLEFVDVTRVGSDLRVTLRPGK